MSCGIRIPCSFSDPNGSAVIHAVRTSGEKFISSLHCVAKKEKSKRVPELGGRELTDLSPDVLTAYIMATAYIKSFTLGGVKKFQI